MKSMFLIFGCVTLTTISSGYIFTINKYENNVLITVNSTVDKIRISFSSVQSIKPKIGSNFVYKYENVNFSPKIINILKMDEYYEIFLQKKYHETTKTTPIKNIFYLVKKVNFWNNLFNTGGD